ncbi:MAG TPA: MBL fold metallo-hydrolase [Kofleriaceae bacterium]|nr:MBL fold metallo-hydrolase [Kofleriaceae bacterium]
MQIQAFFDPDTFTLTYVVFDPASRDALVIDPVLDYDVLSSRTSTRSLEQVADFVRERELRVHHVLETHAHADHLSGSQWLKQHFGAAIAIGERIREVQQTFRDVLDLPHVAIDGSQFDRLLSDGEVFTAGTLRVEVIATPGHTPACVTYRIGDALFTGDALFMHDYGTGRCDFPRGSAEALYDSVMRLYTLPDELRVFPGHDYQPNGREVAWQTTIGQSKRENLQLRATTTKAEFVAMRTARDRALLPPRLLYPSVQINIDAGRLPPAHANGRRYLTTPITEAAAEPFADVDPDYVASRKDAVALVDVREPFEFTGELGHVPGAQLVPLAALMNEAVAWDPEREIVLVCRSGARSARAASELARRGFRHLYNLRGGMIAWNQARLPVER